MTMERIDKAQWYKTQIDEDPEKAEIDDGFELFYKESSSKTPFIQEVNNKIEYHFQSILNLMKDTTKIN